jgi:hypothetical protein
MFPNHLIVSPAASQATISSISVSGNSIDASQQSEGIYLPNGEVIDVRTFSAKSKKWSNKQKTKIAQELVYVAKSDMDTLQCCKQNCVSQFDVKEFQNKRYAFFMKIKKENVF